MHQKIIEYNFQKQIDHGSPQQYIICPEGRDEASNQYSQ